MSHKRTADRLVATLKEAIATLALEPLSGPLRLPRGTKTTDRSRFERLTQTPEAAEILAAVALYLHASGISSGAPDWSVSCLPDWRRLPGLQRATTVSVGQQETLYIVLSSADGAVDHWAYRMGEDGFREGSTPDALFDALDRPDTVSRMREGVARLRAGAPSRRHAWHNTHLMSFLGLENSPSADILGSDAGLSWEVRREYAVALQLRRIHQAKIRRLALRYANPPRCAVCGLGIVALLDAAHLVADVDGGAASSDNIRLFCKNHHWAHDNGLFRWSTASESPVDWIVDPF